MHFFCVLRRLALRKIGQYFFEHAFSFRGVDVALGFKMLIPVARGNFDRPTAMPFDDGRWRGSGTILVVEDEETVRRTVERILIVLGFDVVLACDGRDGVEKFTQDPRRFKLVLLDLTMPKLDGSQVFGEIRRIDPMIPVILMSGYSEQEATARFSGRGLAGFIQKPFDLPLFRHVLKAALT